MSNKESVFINKSIPIKHLCLWDENARFPDEYFKKGEEELINYFLNHEKSFKIQEFAQEVVNDFDLPQSEKLIVLHIEDKFIVLEGNRRLTVYKLIIAPNLTTNNDLIDLFTNLSEQVNITDSLTLECLVTKDIEQAHRYIDRKHIKGNNEVSWGEAERVHHNKRRGSAKRIELIKVGITKAVKSLEFPDELKSKVLGKGYVTSFFRIMTSAPTLESFGIELDENDELVFSNENFEDKLKTIILNVLDKKDSKGDPIHSRSLNKTENIKAYIDSVVNEDHQVTSEKIAEITKEDLFGQKTYDIGGSEVKANKSDKIKNRPIPRGLFFQTDIPFRLKSSSLKIIYDELRDIEVSRFPNATHDLLRSFLECSLVVFFKEINEFHLIAKSPRHNPSLAEMLTHIINRKCTLIKDENLIKVLEAIKRDYTESYSLARLHMINHNENMVSSERDVRTAWAKLENLFKIILRDLN